MKAILLFLFLVVVNGLFAFLMTFLTSQVALLWDVRLTSKERFFVWMFFFFVMPLIKKLEIKE